MINSLSVAVLNFGPLLSKEISFLPCGSKSSRNKSRAVSANSIIFVIIKAIHQNSELT